MRLTEEQKEIKRLQLKKAALRTFLRHGYLSATMKQIAADADMTEGNIYCYYPSKKALFAALAEPIRKNIESLISSGYAMIIQSCRFDTGILEQNIGEAAALFHNYRDETILLFEGSEGSDYQNSKQVLIQQLYSRITELSRNYAAQNNKRIVKGEIYFRLLAVFWVESFLTAIKFSDTEEGIAEGITESVNITLSSMLNAIA
jgi:AcrR family transcriptional regulator